MAEVSLPYVFIAVGLCLLVIALGATWFVANKGSFLKVTRRFDALARLLPFKDGTEPSCLVSVYVDQYQGEGKPTLVRLISDQRSLDTRMWQSSVKMKIGDLLTVELFEDSTFGTFGPRFMGRATVRRKDIETAWDAESLKGTKWVKIEKNGQAIGSLKLELHIVKQHATSISEDEKEALVKEAVVKEKPEDECPEAYKNQEDSASSASETDSSKEAEIEPPPGVEELWMHPPMEDLAGQEHVDALRYEVPGYVETLASPPGYEPPGFEYGASGEYEPGHEAMSDGSAAASYTEDESPLGFSHRMPEGRCWDGRPDDGFERDAPPRLSANIRSSTQSRIDLSILADSLEGNLMKTNSVGAASRFVPNSRWQQRYFKVYLDTTYNTWMLGYWKNEAQMDSGVWEPKTIPMDHISDVNSVRSHYRDQFVIHYRLEDGASGQMNLRVVDRSREEWVEKLDLFIREWRIQTAHEEQL